MGKAAGLNHVSVVAHDLEESVRFYVDILGLELVPTPDFGFPVQWLRAGELQVHVFERPDAPPVHAHFAFEVDDVVALYERARELGILDRTSFGYAIAELPGGEAQLYIRDPAGNLIELDHPDGAAAREQIEEMILLSDRLPQPAGPTPRLFVGSPSRIRQEPNPAA
jgi:catechol 2,3-dioxygenase-like lactoylglutathione lyase family enzyme